MKVIVGEVWQAALGEKSSGVRSVYWVIICPNSLEGKWKDERKGSGSYICMAVTL